MDRQKRKKQGNGMEDPDSIGQRHDNGHKDKHGQDKIERKNPLLGSANRLGSEPKRTKDKTKERKQGQNTCKTQEQAQKQRQGKQQKDTREREEMDWTGRD